LTTTDLLGGLVLKAAAAVADTRDSGRHLGDAALLAALVTDHANDRGRMRGSDRKRLLSLTKALADPYHPAWVALPDALGRAGHDTLRILTA
jgi:hypothetical protein